ncbi:MULTISPECIES: 2-hydroxymuconate tautomerase [Thioclava]|uniref:2-hydroxymuconate tautomerase n=1 Tax=Thioclava TaxID=285107 RepID=UPI0023A80536|nr:MULTISPECIES: 2-hydroxymuconate tautomerase [Thioclava]
MIVSPFLPQSRATDTPRRPRHAGNEGASRDRGAVMPVIQINLMEGRTEAQKEALMREVTRAAVDTLGVKPQAVRIMLNELRSGHYAVAGEPKYVEASEQPAAASNGTAPTNGHEKAPAN